MGEWRKDEEGTVSVRELRKVQLSHLRGSLIEVADFTYTYMDVLNAHVPSSLLPFLPALYFRHAFTDLPVLAWYRGIYFGFRLFLGLNFIVLEVILLHGVASRSV
jgi:hypothetical protein